MTTQAQLRMVLAVLAGAALFGQGAPQTDPFEGTFSSDDLKVELRALPAGAYSGRLLLNDQALPLKGRKASAGRIEGTFTSDGHTYPVTLTLEKGNLRLETEGHEYLLSANAREAAPQAVPTKAVPATGPIHRHETGLTLQLPPNWTAQNALEHVIIVPGGVQYDPNRNDNPEMYGAQLISDYDPSQERQGVEEFASAFTKSGLTLLRRGEREPFQLRGRNGASYTFEFRSPQNGKEYTVRFYVTSEQRNAFVLMAAGESARIYPRDTQLREISTTMNFQAPKPAASGPLADNTPLAQQWLQKLRGKVIRQFFSAGNGGMTGESTRYLAADGSYSMNSNSVISIDVPGASASSIGRDGSSGRWKIRDDNGRLFLQVTRSNGDVSMMPITWDNKNWYLNGDKAFAVDR